MAILSVNKINNNGGATHRITATRLLASVPDGFVPESIGSRVVETSDVTKNTILGNFPHDNNEPIAKRITVFLAGGLTNDYLLSGAGMPGLISSPLKIESITTTKYATAFRAGYWNEFDHEWTVAPQTSVDSFGQDNAARTNRQSPGVITYTLGNKNYPVVTSYSSKTN